LVRPDSPFGRLGRRRGGPRSVPIVATMSLTELQTGRNNQQSCDFAPEPSGETVRRLAVEAGKYAGVESGKTLALDVLRRQVEANGYSPDETDRLLADARLSGAERVAVPAQGNLFGSLWQPAGPWSGDVPADVNDTRGGGVDTKPASVPTDMHRRLSAFEQWCADKDAGSDRPHHAYSAWRANKLYTRANDVDRYFARAYRGMYSTVHIVLSLERQAGESVAEHAGRFWSRTVNNRLREALRDCSVYGRDDDEVGYAGLKVRAPRLPSSGDPQTVCAVTHVHLFLWIERDASRADWDAIRQAHCRLDGADDENNPADDAVSVRVHRPPTGRLTGLSVEVGKNLPCCDTDVDTDARGLPRPYEMWCSELRHGESDSLDSRGLGIVSKLGVFDPMADWMYERRPDDVFEN